MFHCAFLFLRVEEGENGTLISELTSPPTAQEEPGIKLAYDFNLLNALFKPQNLYLPLYLRVPSYHNGESRCTAKQQQWAGFVQAMSQ